MAPARKMLGAMGVEDEKADEIVEAHAEADDARSTRPSAPLTASGSHGSAAAGIRQSGKCGLGELATAVCHEFVAAVVQYPRNHGCCTPWPTAAENSWLLSCHSLKNAATVHASRHQPEEMLPPTRGRRQHTSAAAQGAPKARGTHSPPLSPLLP